MSPRPTEAMVPMPPSLATAAARPARETRTPMPPWMMGSGHGDFSDSEAGYLHDLLPNLLTARQAFPPPKPKELLRAASDPSDSAPRVT